MRAFGVMAALVVSHWLLDFITHRPDMPVYPGGPKVGLGLWNAVAATIVVETAMFAAGVWIYFTSTRARDGAGRWGAIGLVALLLVSYAASILGGAPPSVTAIWIGSIAGTVVIVGLTWWADAHRAPAHD
jgi:hypothetical protein